MRKRILAILASFTVILSLFFLPTAATAATFQSAATGTVSGPGKFYSKLSVKCSQLPTPQVKPEAGIWIHYKLLGKPGQKLYLNPAIYVANGDGRDLLSTSKWDHQVSLGSSGVTHGKLFFRVPWIDRDSSIDFYEAALLVRTHEHRHNAESDVDDSCGVLQVLR